MQDKKIAFDNYKKNKATMVQTGKMIKHITIKKNLRPLLRVILYIQRKLKKQTVEFINRELPEVSSPIVFVVTHIGKYDFEIVNEAIKNHFYIIASDFMNMYGNINGFFMEANGVIFMDIDSKEDRENSRKMMLKVLEQGDNMMIFPEGTWNLSENAIVKDLHLGAVDIALEKSAIIVPIAIEQYGRRFVVNIGKAFDPEMVKEEFTKKVYRNLNENDALEYLLKKQIKLAANQELRDRLATLKWEIWEKEGVFDRNRIPYDYWKAFIEERCSEWPGYSMDEQIRNGCFPPVKREYSAMLKGICRMRINGKNAFLFEEKRQ